MSSDRDKTPEQIQEEAKQILRELTAAKQRQALAEQAEKKRTEPKG